MAPGQHLIDIDPNKRTRKTPPGRVQSAPFDPAATSARLHEGGKTASVVNAVAARVASRIVSRFLQRFVRTAAGEDVAALRVALTDGALVLTDVDLNLAGARTCAALHWACGARDAPRATVCSVSAALLPAGRVSVQRAYAAELRVSVPWGTIATDPVEARLFVPRGDELRVT